MYGRRLIMHSKVEPCIYLYMLMQAVSDNVCIAVRHSRVDNLALNSRNL